MPSRPIEEESVDAPVDFIDTNRHIVAERNHIPTAQTRGYIHPRRECHVSWRSKQTGDLHIVVDTIERQHSATIRIALGSRARYRSVVCSGWAVIIPEISRIVERIETLQISIFIQRRGG